MLSFHDKKTIMLKKLIKKGQKKTRNQEWVPTQHVWSIMGMRVVRGVFLIGGTNLHIAASVYL
jgi:hypothetical protein